MIGDCPFRWDVRATVALRLSGCAIVLGVALSGCLTDAPSPDASIEKQFRSQIGVTVSFQHPGKWHVQEVPLGAEKTSLFVMRLSEVPRRAVTKGKESLLNETRCLVHARLGIRHSKSAPLSNLREALTDNEPEQRAKDAPSTQYEAVPFDRVELPTVLHRLQGDYPVLTIRVRKKGGLTMQRTEDTEPWHSFGQVSVFGPSLVYLVCAGVPLFKNDFVQLADWIAESFEAVP